MNNQHVVLQSTFNYQQRINELTEQNNNLNKTYNSLSNDLISINEYDKIKNKSEELNNETVHEFEKIIKQLEQLNNKTINESEGIKKILKEFKNNEEKNKMMNCQQRIIELIEQNKNFTPTYNSFSDKIKNRIMNTTFALFLSKMQ